MAVKKSVKIKVLTTKMKYGLIGKVGSNGNIILEERSGSFVLHPNSYYAIIAFGYIDELALFFQNRKNEIINSFYYDIHPIRSVTYQGMKIFDYFSTLEGKDLQKQYPVEIHLKGIDFDCDALEVTKMRKFKVGVIGYGSSGEELFALDTKFQTGSQFIISGKEKDIKYPDNSIILTSQENSDDDDIVTSQFWMYEQDILNFLSEPKDDDEFYLYLESTKILDEYADFLVDL